MGEGGLHRGEGAGLLIRRRRIALRDEERVTLGGRGRGGVWEWGKGGQLVGRGGGLHMQ